MGRYVYHVIAYDVERGDFFRDRIKTLDVFGEATVWSDEKMEWQKPTDTEVVRLEERLDDLDIDEV